MVTEQKQAVLDAGAAEALAERFAEVFSTLDPGELFAPDAFFDLNMPVWRFQIEGADAMVAQLRKLHQGPTRIDIHRVIPTASGFVTEQEEHQEVDGEDLSARRMWLCEVHDGRITEVVGYCSGEWDEALRTRHAAEAPMIRT